MQKTWYGIANGRKAPSVTASQNASTSQRIHDSTSKDMVDALSVPRLQCIMNIPYTAATAYDGHGTSIRLYVQQHTIIASYKSTPQFLYSQVARDVFPLLCGCYFCHFSFSVACTPNYGFVGTLAHIPWDCCEDPALSDLTNPLPRPWDIVLRN